MKRLATTMTEGPTSGVEAQAAAEAAQKGMPLPDYLVTVIRERGQKPSEGLQTYLLSDSALVKDWLRPKGDEAKWDL